MADATVPSTTLARATQAGAPPGQSVRAIRWLTYLMFFMFAMTTDSVGVIIPQLIAEFQLSMTAAGALHYGSMSAIALAGIGVGFLADRFGRKRTIILGLALFTSAAFLFPSTDSGYWLACRVGRAACAG